MDYLHNDRINNKIKNYGKKRVNEIELGNEVKLIYYD